MIQLTQWRFHHQRDPWLAVWKGPKRSSLPGGACRDRIKDQEKAWGCYRQLDEELMKRVSMPIQVHDPVPLRAAMSSEQDVPVLSE